MHYKTMFKGDFIAGAELVGKPPATVTIAGVKLEKLETLSDDGDGKKKDKGIIAIKGSDRGWVLNRTNAECLAAMFGADTDGWIGRRVTLHAEEVQVGRKREPGIRVTGSPDLSAPLDVEIRLPRKRPVTRTLTPTATKAKRAPALDPATGEREPAPSPAHRCQADRCTSQATHGPGGEPVMCWAHAGDWPEVRDA